VAKKGRKGKKEKKEISPEPEPTPKMEKSTVKRSAPRELANVATVSVAKEEAISVGNTNAGLHEAFVTAMSSVVGGGGARPYEQVGEGEYVLDSGKTRLKVRTINGVVLARVGRGWEPLETFLATHLTPSSATPASASPETPAANNAQEQGGEAPASPAEIVQAAEAPAAPAVPAAVAAVVSVAASTAPAPAAPAASTAPAGVAAAALAEPILEPANPAPVAAEEHGTPKGEVDSVVADPLGEETSAFLPSIPMMIGVGVVAVSLYFLLRRKGDLSR